MEKTNKKFIKSILTLLSPTPFSLSLVLNPRILYSLGCWFRHNRTAGRWCMSGRGSAGAARGLASSAITTREAMRRYASASPVSELVSIPAPFHSLLSVDCLRALLGSAALFFVHRREGEGKIELFFSPVMARTHGPHELWLKFETLMVGCPCFCRGQRIISLFSFHWLPPLWVDWSMSHVPYGSKAQLSAHPRGTDGEIKLFLARQWQEHMTHMSCGS